MSTYSTFKDSQKVKLSIKHNLVGKHEEIHTLLVTSRYHLFKKYFVNFSQVPGVTCFYVFIIRFYVIIMKLDFKMPKPEVKSMICDLTCFVVKLLQEL